MTSALLFAVCVAGLLAAWIGCAVCACATAKQRPMRRVRCWNHLALNEPAKKAVEIDPLLAPA
jgi:hypothetical protein